MAVVVAAALEVVISASSLVECTPSGQMLAVVDMEMVRIPLYLVLCDLFRIGVGGFYGNDRGGNYGGNYNSGGSRSDEWW